MATTVKDKKWYVVRAVSGQEAKIKRLYYVGDNAFWIRSFG